MGRQTDNGNNGWADGQANMCMHACMQASKQMYAHLEWLELHWHCPVSVQK